MQMVFQDPNYSLNPRVCVWDTVYNTLKVNKDLTAENYRIMESKYNNQLAILLDLIDASNAKLDAELQFANSEINIVFAYYKLLKEAGTL